MDIKNGLFERIKPFNDQKKEETLFYIKTLFNFARPKGIVK